MAWCDVVEPCSGLKACRIEGHEGSPVRLPLDRHCHAVPGSSYGLRGDGPSAPRLGFHRRPNRPDEAQEFAPDGRHDLQIAFGRRPEDLSVGRLVEFTAKRAQ